MKTTIYVIGFIFILMAALSVPAGVVHGVYEWVANDMEFKFALWEGVKLWLIMLSAIIPGYPMFVLAAIK